MNLQEQSDLHRNDEPKHGLNAVTSLRLHWPECVMELAETGLYLFFTCVFATVLQHPASPIRHLPPTGIVRRACFGISVSTTIAAIVATPWGKQSGGHFNPAITFTLYRLGKVQLWDAIFYGVAQFAGATAGVAISFVLMLTVLFASNHSILSRYTPYFVGALYAIFITLETPLSGMSMNPARTFGSAFRARYWHALWIYFLAPTLGMLLAAVIFLWVRGGLGPDCAKLNHANDKRCIFRHGTGEVRLLNNSLRRH